MKCPECGSKTRVSVEVVITMPGEFRKVTKNVIRMRAVTIDFVRWDRQMFNCIRCEWISKSGG